MKVIDAFRISPPKGEDAGFDYKFILDGAVTLHHDSNPQMSEVGTNVMRKFFSEMTTYLLEEGVEEVENNIVIALYREEGVEDNAITLLLTDTPKSAKGEEEFAYILHENAIPAIGY